jgi:hypothetical protein
MMFPGVEDQSVELQITNYQFPHQSVSNDYDRNWLIIYIDVKSKLGNWRTSDASLLTWEVEELINWLSDISNNNEVKWNPLEFIEPNLSFEIEKNEDSSKRLQIRFQLESRPKTASDDIDYFVDCVLTNEEIKQIAQGLQIELEKYPQR